MGDDIIKLFNMRKEKLKGIKRRVKFAEHKK
jgi:hypothetical protein